VTERGRKGCARQDENSRLRREKSLKGVNRRRRTHQGTNGKKKRGHKESRDKQKESVGRGAREGGVRSAEGRDNPNGPAFVQGLKHYRMRGGRDGRRCSHGKTQGESASPVKKAVRRDR